MGKIAFITNNPPAIRDNIVCSKNKIKKVSFIYQCKKQCRRKYLYKYKDSREFQKFIKDNGNPDYIYFCPCCGGFDMVKENAHDGYDSDCMAEPEKVLVSKVLEMEVFT